MGVVERFAKLTGLPPPKIVAAPRPKPKPTTPIQRVVALREKSVKTRTPSTKKQVVEAIIGKPLPVKDKTLTAQQYLQETAETKRGISRQKSEFQTRVEDIKPGLYRYEGRLVHGVLLKSKLKREYTPQFEKAEVQSQLAWQQARDLPKDTKVTKIDKGYSFEFRDTSLDWSKGEFAKIEKLRGEARKHTERQFEDPVAGITGAVQHVGAGIAEFGFGAVSSFGALIKPIVLDPLIGTPESRGKHFVSPLDVAFEPIGWSPKGSTELMAKHPIFTAGGIAGEVVQSYALTQAFKPISAGVKIGAKGLVKRVPVVYAKFTKVFPEEKLIKLSPKQFAKTLSKKGIKTTYVKGLKVKGVGEVYGAQRTLWKDIGWIYRPSESAIKRATIAVEKKLPITKIGSFVRSKGKTAFKKYGFGIPDIKYAVPTRGEVLGHEISHFLYPGMSERSIRNITAKISRAGGIPVFKKTLPGKIQSFASKFGTKEIPKTTYRWGAKGYQKGLQLTSAGVKTTPKEIIKAGSIIEKKVQKTAFGRGAVKRVWLSPKEFAKAEKDIVSKLALKKTVVKSGEYKITGYGGKGSVLTEKTKFTLSPFGKRLIKKYGTKKQIWKFGDDLELYKRRIPSKYGSIERYALEGADIPLKESEALGLRVYSKTGKFLGYKKPALLQKSLPKRWISTYRTPFLKNIEAQMSATVQKFKHKIPSPSFIGGKRGLKTSLTKVTVPSSLYKPLYKTGLELGFIGLVKTVPKVKRKYGIKPMLITDQFKQQTPALKLGKVSLLDTFAGQNVAQVQKPGFKPFQDIAQVSLVEKAFDFDIPKPKISKPVISMVTPSVPIIPFLPKRLYGRGRRRYDYGLYGKERKFRKRKTFDPLKLDIKINLKGM